MVLKNDSLHERIETCRKRMIELAATTSFTNKAVVDLSMELDELLNQYDLLKNKGSNS